MKLIYTFLFFFTLGFYLIHNKRKSSHYFETCIDKKIPLIPIFIIPYLMYFPFLVTAFLILWGTDLYLDFIKMMLLSTLINSLFWIIFPNGAKREKTTKKGFFYDCIRLLRKIDEESNAFPSSHVSQTLIVCFWMVILYPAYVFIISFICLSIVISVVFTKQHYVADIFGGIISFLVSYVIVLL